MFKISPACVCVCVCGGGGGVGVCGGYGVGFFSIRGLIFLGVEIFIWEGQSC